MSNNTDHTHTDGIPVRQAIQTRFAGPTDKRGARWIVAGGGTRHTVPYDYAAGRGGEAAAAQALATELGWGRVTAGASHGDSTYWTTEQ